ncbi:lipoprotein insertase outer membrane protein LolB [Aestuariibacter halophilus]|uniref:Outer-membrane lipoprotein LolB n=1 Tax=Fluctibacter halophilus TaxID=226011 RepID=A0ABS8G9X6_9ALTE|nr:lipoprotein insertase outer membrane protein LolB [Aestuariibacter halophilus]MCC2616021.1 lipoprotein insertase outer membrane protein LolB [Aestuariibacter halophilus]
MHAFRLAIITLVINLLAACAQRPPPQVLDQPLHQQQLASIINWQLNGRLAFKSPEDKFSATLNWQQQNQQFELALTSFIGSTLMEMSGQPGLVTLDVDDQRYLDSNASALLRRITGWQIPVNQLPQWIKGQALANDMVEYDEFGRIQRLLPGCSECAQWEIRYNGFQRVGEVWLPGDIRLVNLDDPRNSIKIRVNEWRMR